MKTLFSDCDPTVADDRTLPTNAFLIEYLQDGMTKFDIVMSSKKVEIFDWYWDRYRNDLKNITQCEGCLLYTSPSPRDLSTSRMPSSA